MYYNVIVLKLLFHMLVFDLQIHFIEGQQTKVNVSFYIFLRGPGLFHLFITKWETDLC